MNNKLKLIFMKVFNLDEDKVTDNIEYEKTEGWSSMSHLVLITELESEFNISLDPDDILIMGTVPRIVEVLKKHNVDL